MFAETLRDERGTHAKSRRLSGGEQLSFEASSNNRQGALRGRAVTNGSTPFVVPDMFEPCTRWHKRRSRAATLCTAPAQAASLPPLGDADQFGEFLLTQRRRDEFELDRIGHHLLDPRDAIGIDRGGRQEFPQCAPRGLRR